MTDMTDEEYDALDELWTRTTPKLAAGKQGGFFTERRERLAHTIEVDNFTTQWLRVMTESTHKTPAEIIGTLVREKVFANA
jgi:hypothetical protein